MSEAGRKKKLERRIKKARRALLVPYEKMSKHDQAVFDRGMARLKLAIEGRRIPDMDD